MEKKQTHREPTLYIVGNDERADEIRHILEDEWGGCNKYDYKCDSNKFVYFIDSFGNISNEGISTPCFIKTINNGWMKEYKLPEKPQFKPFDKVVAKAGDGCIWIAAFYSHKGSTGHIATNCREYQYCLPYNEETAKLIGTSDEWKGGDNE